MKIKISKRRIFLLIIFSFIIFLTLTSYFFQRSRAERITSNKEYLQTLQELSKRRNLPGNIPTPTAEPQAPNSNYLEVFYNFLLSLFRKSNK